MEATTIHAPVKLKEMTKLGDLTPDVIEKPGTEPTIPAEEFEDRAGYDPAFLEGWQLLFLCQQEIWQMICGS
jgi:hypothetical protein